MADIHNSQPTGHAGYWSAANTWDKAAAPAAGDSVIITANDTVYYDIPIGSQVSLAALTVTGTLRFPTSVSSYLVDGTTQNTSGQAVVKCASTTGMLAGAMVVISDTTPQSEALTILTVDSTTQFTCTGNLTQTHTAALTAKVVCQVTPAGQLNSVSPTAVTGLGLLMADTVSITGAGALYVGNSTTDYIARPAAAATYAPNVTITLGTTGVISVTTQRYYGWIPTTPAAHPAYTTITGRGAADSNPPLATDTTIRVADSNFDVQQGEQILVGVGGTAGLMAEANKGLYTCNAAPSSSVITISTGGGLVTNRVLGDYVSVYSRPILITKPVTSATVNTVTSGIMQGVRINLTKWTSGTGWTFTGVTNEGGNNATGLTTLGPNTFTDCVGSYITNGAFSGTGSSTNPGYNLLVNCIVFNGGALVYNDFCAVLNGCVSQNSGLGMLANCYMCRLTNCVSLASAGLVYIGSGHTLLNCTSSASDATNLDITYARGLILYNCTLSSGAFVANYQGTSLPTWAPVQSYKHGGVTGARALWCRGGIGTTNQSTQVYSTTNGTMKFTITSTAAYLNTPLIWDTPFWMPANKSLTFTVPMYATASEGITADVIVINPYNDPLWYDPLYTVTPTQSTASTTTGSTTVTYVVARTAMPTPDSLWHNVTVTVPAHTEARQLIARIILKGTTVSKLAYAHLDMMEAQLLGKKKVYL